MLVSSILALPKFTLARSLALDLYCWLFYEVQSQNLSSMQSSHDWYRSNYFFFLALSIFLFAFHSTLLLLLSIICGIYLKGWLWSWKHNFSFGCNISIYHCSCLWFFVTCHWLSEGLFSASCNFLSRGSLAIFVPLNLM